MAAVQFFGVKPVVDAYEKRNIACWAIFQGKEMLTAGCDAESLREYLEMLAPGGTAAIYSLRFYRDEEDPDNIRPKTEYDGGFSFKLNQSGEGSMGMVRLAGGGGTSDMVMQKVHGIISEEIGRVIEERFNGKPEKEKKKTLSDFVMGLLEDPEELIGVIGAIKSLFSPGSAQALPMVLNGVTAPTRRAGEQISNTTPEMNNEEKLARLAAALDKLEKYDPKIVEHLEKLSILAETKPGLFKMLISNLNEL